MDNLRVIENELVPVYETDKGIKVVYGTELHSVLQVKSRYREWVDRRIADCEAVSGEDFQEAEISAPSGQTKKEHIIMLDTAKEMAMLERNDIGKRVRKYFIEVERKHKQSVIDRSALSPQTVALMDLVNGMARQEIEVKRQAEQINRIEKKQDAIVETFSDTTDTEDFKAWVNRCIAKIAESTKYTNGSTRAARYQNVRSESYDRLNQKRSCRLSQRVAYAKETALQNGATKTYVNNINKLTVISTDKDLKPIYETVIKEMMIYYCVE